MYDGSEWHQYTIKDGLANDQIESFFEDNSGNIWAITRKGISRFSGNQTL